jgi:hypothetical protein
MPKAENIKSHEFKKGESGNPDGRPVGTKNRSTILKKWIEVNVKIKDKSNPTLKEIDGTVEDQIILALIAKARSGDVQAIKEINDTLYGKIVENQRIDLNIPSLPKVIIE